MFANKIEIYDRKAKCYRTFKIKGGSINEVVPEKIIFLDQDPEGSKDLSEIHTHYQKLDNLLDAISVFEKALLAF